MEMSRDKLWHFSRGLGTLEVEYVAPLQISSLQPPVLLGGGVGGQEGGMARCHQGKGFSGAVFSFPSEYNGFTVISNRQGQAITDLSWVITSPF